MRRLGITVSEHCEMLSRQGGVCAICRAEPTKGTSLVIDHDHAIPGEGRASIRGLICNDCNYQRLPIFGDNPALLRAAADYLEKWPARQVLR
jgi:C4-type Zn-finger protein